MTGQEIKALRRTLDLTARKLGETLGVDQATVLAWEREELFPTKRYVDAMLALRGEEGAATVEAAVGSATMGRMERDATVLRALADPAVWGIFRKLVAFAELRAEVEKLAARYPEPGDD